MAPLLLAAVLAAASCPNDLALTNPRLRVVQARERGYDHEIVTVDVENRGAAGQPIGLRQRLELVMGGKVLGTQPLPALGPRIKPDYTDADLPWLRGLVQALERDGLASVVETGEGERVALP